MAYHSLLSIVAVSFIPGMSKATDQKDFTNCHIEFPFIALPQNRDINSVYTPSRITVER